MTSRRLSRGNLSGSAVNAADEMATNLPGGAGTGIQARVSEFSPSNNYVGVNLGQLKYVSEPFYVRLIQEQYTNSYPWSTNSTGDDANYSPANIGQLKNVFSFDVMADPDEDGMPDWWEMVYFGTLTNASGGDCDGDGLANSAEFVAGSDPTDSDTDDDGMTDDWEVEYDLDVRDSADASEDADGDTFSNLEEYTMGTDPGEPDPVNNAAFRLNSGCGDIYFVSNQVSGSTAYGDLATMQQVSQEQAEQGSFSLYSCAGDIYTADSGFHASSTDTYTTIYRESAMFTSSSGAALVLIIDSYKDAPPGPGEYMGGLLLYRAHLLGTPIVYRTNDATAQITVISENEFTWSVDLDYAGGVVEIRVPWSVFTVVGVPLLDIDEEETDSALCLGCGCSNCAADITVKARPSVETGHLEVVVMDGNDLIAEIYDDNCFGGTYHLQWDGTMTNGQPADPGTYTIDAAWTIGTNDPCTDSEEISILRVDSETVATVPADRARKTLGVGEEVTLTLEPSSLSPVTWSISGNGTLSSLTTNPITFTADDTASSGTVTATYNGHGCDVTFAVIEPTGISMQKLSESNYPPGQAGAGMYTEITMLPITVSFYSTEFLEIPGPASSVSGYFTNYTPAQLYHDPSSNWCGFGYDNVSVAQDICATPILPPPWSAGYFVWHIPWHYRMVGSSSGGTQFTVVDQEFQIWSNGTVEVRKAGASVQRSP